MTLDIQLISHLELIGDIFKMTKSFDNLKELCIDIMEYIEIFSYI
jgi:hypothetical protein